MAHSRLLRRSAVAALLPLTLALGACQVGAEKYGPCAPTPDGNPLGTNGTYVLVCIEGKWKPLMSVQDFVTLRSGGTLPDKDKGSHDKGSHDKDKGSHDKGGETKDPSTGTGDPAT